MTFSDGPIETHNLNLETHKITDQESSRILKFTQIHGEGFNKDPEIFKDNGLEPKYKFQVQEREFIFSQPFFDYPEDGHPAFIVYVQQGEDYIARTIYKSTSQGMWRIYPYYSFKKEGDTHLGKGYDEQSITLPTTLQIIAENVSKNTKIFDTPNGEKISLTTCYLLHPDKLQYLYKTWKSSDPTLKKKYADIAMDTYPADLDYEKQVDPIPLLLEGNFYVPNPDNELPDPTTLHFTNPDQNPDFSKKSTSRKTDTSLYGEITIDVFPSKDKKLLYSFCRDALGRAWIGMIETEGEIQSVGVRRNWVDGGVLAIPAYEYDHQEGGYGNHELKKGNYVDMYKNFHSKIPVIQAYQATIKP